MGRTDFYSIQNSVNSCWDLILYLPFLSLSPNKWPPLTWAQIECKINLADKVNGIHFLHAVIVRSRRGFYGAETRSVFTIHILNEHSTKFVNYLHVEWEIDKNLIRCN